MMDQTQRGLVRAIAEDAGEMTAASSALSRSQAALHVSVLQFVEHMHGQDAADAIRKRGVDEAECGRFAEVGMRAIAAVESHDYAALGEAVGELMSPTQAEDEQPPPPPPEQPPPDAPPAGDQPPPEQPPPAA